MLYSTQSLARKQIYVADYEYMYEKLKAKLLPCPSIQHYTRIQGKREGLVFSQPPLCRSKFEAIDA